MVNGVLVSLTADSTGQFSVAKLGVVLGCSDGMPCSSLTCPMNSSCDPLWREGQCVCEELAAPHGELCVFPCDSKPCLNGGDCRPNRFEPLRECQFALLVVDMLIPVFILFLSPVFNCVCTSLATGSICEINLFPCTVGFYRLVVTDPCIPCVCDRNGVTSNICYGGTGECICDVSAELLQIFSHN